MKMSALALLGLLVSIPFGAAVSISCETYPSADFKDRGMKCSGSRVTEIPRFLPTSLQILLLSETAITSLDNATFQGRDLPELTTLIVTGGSLTSVGANAFSSLPALWKLDLSGNDNLHRLDASSFTNNKLLRVVDLSHNPMLRHLPPFNSSSIEAMYIDDSDLKSVDVEAVKGISTLKVLSLSDNPDLLCHSDKRRLEQALPGLSVTCGDSEEDQRPQLPTEGRESPPPNSVNNSHPTIHEIQKDVENTASHIRYSLWTLVVVAIFFTVFPFLCCLYVLKQQSPFMNTADITRISQTFQ